MAINATELINEMRAALIHVVGAKWHDIRNYAETEFKKLAVVAEDIEAQYHAHQITDEEAAVLIEIQKNAARAVLLGAEGMSLLLAEAAINAVVDVLKQAIKDATGVVLY